MNNKKFLSLVLSLVMVLGTFTSVFAASETDKKDEKTTETKVEKVEKIVGKDNKIQYIIDKKFVEGYGDGDYGYDKQIKRSEITKLLVFANGHKDLSEKLQGTMKLYKDVDTAYWANGVIAVGTTVPSSSNNQAMLNGYPDGNFLPENNVTYAELAKMLVVLVKEDLTADDVKKANANWAGQWMSWAAQLNILDDVVVKDSNAAATRADAFTMLYNALYKMQNFKREPANEKLGVISKMNNKELTLNDDKDEKYTITDDTVIVRDRDEFKEETTNVIKVKSVRNPEYYIGSLVRVMANDKKEITHILELGNPEDGALGRDAAKKDTISFGNNDRWNGVADKTVATYMDDKLTTLKEDEIKNKNFKSYVNFKLDNEDEVEQIVFNDKDGKVVTLDVEDDTKIFIANPANNQVKKVKDIDEAVSLLGYKSINKNSQIPNVYAGFDDDSTTTASGNKYHDKEAKVIVFNIVKKDNDNATLYRVLESASSKGKAILEDVDGKKFDYDFFDNKADFPYNYGEKYDVVEVKYQAYNNSYKVTKELEHDETDDYPIVEIVKTYNDGKRLDIEDYKGRKAFVDIKDADLFTGKLEDLEKGNIIQIKRDGKTGNKLSIVSVLPNKTDLEGSIKGMFDTEVNKDAQVGVLTSIVGKVAEFDLYDSVSSDKITDDASVTVDEEVAKILKELVGEKFQFTLKENDNVDSEYYGTKFELVVLIDGKAEYINIGVLQELAKENVDVEKYANEINTLAKASKKTQDKVDAVLKKLAEEEANTIDSLKEKLDEIKEANKALEEAIKKVGDVELAEVTKETVTAAVKEQINNNGIKVAVELKDDNKKADITLTHEKATKKETKTINVSVKEAN